MSVGEPMAVQTITGVLASAELGDKIDVEMSEDSEASWSRPLVVHDVDLQRWRVPNGTNWRLGSVETTYEMPSGTPYRLVCKPGGVDAVRLWPDEPHRDPDYRGRVRRVSIVGSVAPSTLAEMIDLDDDRPDGDDSWRQVGKHSGSGGGA